jgi:hypothetical protein
MAKAGRNADAQAMAEQQLTVAERAADRVLAKIGWGDERTVAEIRLAVADEAESARAVLGPIGEAAANGSMSPNDRLGLEYAGQQPDRLPPPRLVFWPVAPQGILARSTSISAASSSLRRSRSH